MGLLSVELPASCELLVTQPAFEAYTIDNANHGIRKQLDSLNIDSLFPEGCRDNEMASCCISGIWLLHNFLNESHEISQDIQSPEGSYWHGIMHRMEGDYWNSKYWYRRVGQHEVFSTVETNWDPYVFVDQCEAASSQGGDAIQRVQQIAVNEWISLFEYCFENAS